MALYAHVLACVVTSTMVTAFGPSRQLTRYSIPETGTSVDLPSSIFTEEAAGRTAGWAALSDA